MALKVGKAKFGNLGDQSILAFGAMTMSGAYNTSPLDTEEAMKVFEECLKIGITHIDTAQAYAWGKNEILVGKAIQKFDRKNFFIATKFGFVKDSKTGLMGGVDSSPENVRKVCMESLSNLNTSYIDLFYQHRPDPKVPIEDTVKELKKLIEEGKIRGYGLSESPPDLIKRAHAIHPCTAVQSEFSVWVQDPLKNGVLETCRELGIAFVPFSPLGRGLLAGAVKSVNDLPKNDFRRGIPRFTGENLDKNLILMEKFTSFAKSKNCTPAQLALAWLLHQGNDIFPLFATRSVSRLHENCASVNVKLSKEEVDYITKLWENPSGSRMWGGYKTMNKGNDSNL